MSIAEIHAFYDQQIAGMSPHEQLNIAREILNRLAVSSNAQFEDEDPAVILQRQKSALKKICGIVEGGDPEASIRHDEILYGTTNS